MFGVIAVDLRSACYYPGHGIGTYTAELFAALPKACHSYQVIGDTLGHRRRPRRAQHASIATASSQGLPGEHFWSMASRPAQLRGDEVLWHNPHNGLGIPQLASGEPALVVTIHDLIPLILPDAGRQSYARDFAAKVPDVAATASAIITASEHSRQDLIRLLRLPPEKIHVIPEAARAACRPLPKSVARLHVSTKYGLKHPFALYVGGFGQRKNVAALVEGFARALQHLPHGCQLAVVGAPERTHGQVTSLVHRLGCASQVVFTDHVPEADLVALYSAADLFVFPSLYEGFGLPPLEAMACGCPVVCSKASSLPEVCGDAALLIDARHPEEIAGAMAAVLNDQELAGALARRGLAQAASFSWQLAAEATAQVYAQVLTDTKATAEGCK